MTPLQYSKLKKRCHELDCCASVLINTILFENLDGYIFHDVEHKIKKNKIKT